MPWADRQQQAFFLPSCLKLPSTSLFDRFNLFRIHCSGHVFHCWNKGLTPLPVPWDKALCAMAYESLCRIDRLSVPDGPASWDGSHGACLNPVPDCTGSGAASFYIRHLAAPMGAFCALSHGADGCDSGPDSAFWHCVPDCTGGLSILCQIARPVSAGSIPG